MKRNSYTAAFKAKVALEAAKEQQTINAIAAAYQVHPNQVSAWKKALLEGLPQMFSTPRGPKAAEEAALKERLYSQIGQLKVELDFLKKKLGLST